MTDLLIFSVVCVNASNGLILYEIRDKFAKTIDFKCYNNTSNTFIIKIDISKYKFLYPYIELFLLDTKGNIEKFNL